MLYKILLLSTLLVCSECVEVYSSFYAPLFDRRILNYRVDARFDPDAGRDARQQYQSEHGYRGEKLIADLGNGRGPARDRQDDANRRYGDVNFYYT